MMVKIDIMRNVLHITANKHTKNRSRGPEAVYVGKHHRIGDGPDTDDLEIHIQGLANQARPQF
jgi:hypothetical protein